MQYTHINYATSDKSQQVVLMHQDKMMFPNSEDIDCFIGNLSGFIVRGGNT